MNTGDYRAGGWSLASIIGLVLTCAVSLHVPAGAQTASPRADLTLQPSAFVVAPRSNIEIGNIGTPVTFTTEKPEAITKEPTYRSKPKYGVIHVGNGPKSAYYMAFDEPADGNWKVYFDKNQNGDLTDDGDGAFPKKNKVNGTVVYGVNNYLLRASWGTETVETGHADYGIGLFRDPLSNNAVVFREAARSGELIISGEHHKVQLIENDGDALFNKPVDTDAATGKPTGTVTGQPVWLLLDTNRAGPFTPATALTLDARAPFRIGDFVYEATIADDGSSISLARSTKAAAQLTTDSLPPASPAPSASEPIVPNFSALAWGGGAIGPADFRGKILILDFWATWCGPCQKSMPHIERVYEAARNKNVAVLAVCVWDDKASCNNWMRTNLSKYSFTLAFDPAGKDNGNSIARKLFKVTGIPTTIVIDAEGHIAETIVGYSDGDTRLESALKKLGVDL